MPSGDVRRGRAAARRRPGIVTLLTDFGTADAYVGAMKGVILGIFPEAKLVDLSHDVPPQDVKRAALLLRDVVRFFPPGTVHLAVVDPGVGTRRRAIAVDATRDLFVGPDNGIFGPALAGRRHRTFALPQRPRGDASPTFHGRDLFAPAAAHLAAGASPASLGRAVRSLLPSTIPAPRRRRGRIEGEVAFVDRFGNLVTNIPASLLPLRARCTVKVGPATLRRVRRAYGDARPGELLALVESTGHLEVAECMGNAAQRLGVTAGSAVEVWG